jgi:hypothetical protein
VTEHALPLTLAHLIELDDALIQLGPAAPSQTPDLNKRRADQRCRDALLQR